MCVAITILLLAYAGFSQECPKVMDEKVALKFLLDNKANSTAADRHCVDDAFGILANATASKNKNYVKFLVGMLDFERSMPDYAEASERKYPAISELQGLHGMYLQGIGKKNVVPHLIKAIRESDSEVLRANAAEALSYPSRCGALKLLAQEGEKEDVPYEQKLRLEAAAKHINDWTVNQPCEANASKP